MLPAGDGHARYRDFGVHGMQAAELYDDTQQEEVDRSAADEEVLPVLSPASSASRDKVGRASTRCDSRPVAQFGRAPVSKTGGWGFESLLACHNRLSVRAMAEAEGESVDWEQRVKSVVENARGNVAGWLGRSRTFIAEVRNELRRVTWPSRSEVYATTFVVILTAIFFGVYLWSIDLVLNGVAGWIFQAFGAA